MTMLDAVPTFGSTSAAGPMGKRHSPGWVYIGPFIFAGLGTSSAYNPTHTVALPACSDQTSAGATIAVVDSGGAAIAELRRLTGLTWDQLARLFAVSRRALHFWASGKVMTSANEEHLQRLLAVARRVDRGSVGANRTGLLAVRDDGTIAFDLLAAGQYEGAALLLGSGDAGRVAAPKLSDAAMAARAPRPPAELVGGHEDRVPRGGGRLLKAKPVRVGGK